MSLSSAPWRRLPPRDRKRIRRLARRPRWGNLRRPEPFSRTFGFDRGTPIDRHYMDAFFTIHGDAIGGVVGEVAGPLYTERFGGDGVRRTEIIDIDPTNLAATVIVDLAEPDSLPPASFDCLVIAQTLQYTTQPEAAVTNCVQALRPGGRLLLAVPALAPHGARERPEDDHWRFWPAGVAAMLARVSPDGVHTVVGYGNLVAAVAFLQGLSTEDLRPRDLAPYDPSFPVVVCARLDVPDGDEVRVAPVAVEGTP